MRDGELVRSVAVGGVASSFSDEEVEEDERRGASREKSSIDAGSDGPEVQESVDRRGSPAAVEGWSVVAEAASVRSDLKVGRLGVDLE